MGFYPDHGARDGSPGSEEQQRQGGLRAPGRVVGVREGKEVVARVSDTTELIVT